MRPWHVGVCLLVLAAALFTAMHSFTTMSYFCSECASGRSDKQFRPFGCRSLATSRGRAVETEFTALVTAVDRAPCAHRWVFAVGSGGAYA